jgi:DNA-binding Xre family transcriptional regulator
MKYKILKTRLDALMAQRGIGSYQALAEQATAQGIRLAFSTIYQVVNAESDTAWRSSTLAALCHVLKCSPVDLIPELAAPVAAKEHEHE